MLWTVAFYVFLTYMPTYTRTQLHLTAAQSLWASTASLLALVVLVPLMGALSDRIGRKKLLLCSCALCFIIPIPGFLCFDARLRLCFRRSDPDHFFLCYFNVFGPRAGRHRGNFSDPRPVNLDVFVLRACRRDVRAGSRRSFLSG